MLEVSAEVVADSIGPQGKRIVTLEVNLHRFVLAELEKHRVLSMSAQSSRAVPIEKYINLVDTNPAMPLYWGKKQRGMVADEQHNAPVILGGISMSREEAWLAMSQFNIEGAEAFDKAGYHKQVINRALETWLWQKAVLTATEWDNFFKLRLHKNAQPEIRVLAEKIKEAMDASQPKFLLPGEWHLPYADRMEWNWSLENQIKYSAAKCASISYRTESLTLPKALEIFQTLVEDDPQHSVPLEHQATPMSTVDAGLIHGVTHWKNTPSGVMSIPCSGNFEQWVQYRQLHEAKRYQVSN